MTTLDAAILGWTNTQQGHKRLNDQFTGLVNALPWLKEHRDYVEANAHGFGERAFQWLWLLLVEQMPDRFIFMEIGVFKGQVLSLVELLARKNYKTVDRYGVTPLSSIGGVWDSDYKADIERIHDVFNLAKDYTIIKGDSTEPGTIAQTAGLALDILYIDGGHTQDIAASDIRNYGPLVKPGGFLVIDDCANDLPMPFGYFTGIAEVTKAVNDSALIRREFEFLFSLVHIKVWRRKNHVTS